MRPAWLRAVALLCLVTLAAPSPLWAQPQEGLARAQVLDVEGSGLFRAGKYAAALERFQAAYEAWPNPNSAWNIARCYEELGQLSKATGAFKLYLSLEHLTEADRQDAQQHLEALEERLLQWRGAVKRARHHDAKGQDPEALAAWREAMSLYPSAETRFYLADALIRVALPREARHHLKVLLQDPELDAERRLRSQQMLEELEAPPEPQPRPAPRARQEPPVQREPVVQADQGEVRPLVGWSLVGGAGVLTAAGGWLLWGYRQDLEAQRRASGTPGALKEYERLDQALDRGEWGMGVTFGLAAVSLGAGLWALLGAQDAPEAGQARRLELLWGPAGLGARGSF